MGFQSGDTQTPRRNGVENGVENVTCHSGTFAVMGFGPHHRCRLTPHGTAAVDTEYSKKKAQPTLILRVLFHAIVTFVFYVYYLPL